MRERILVADDNAPIRGLIRSLLEEKGYAVCGEAENGTEAIEKARKLKPDLICLDLSMPGMNGVEVASVLKRLMPTIPIVMFTLYEHRMNEALAQAAGIDVVLGKENATKLTESIAELLSRREVHRP